MRISKIVLYIAAAGFSMISTASWSANLVLINIDPPGAGLNDPTPADPVGGNAGTTVGEQRVNVYLAAAEEWGSRVASDVPIIVVATFEPLPCNATNGVLGGASPWNGFVNFPNAPLPLTIYISALADALAGFDLEPGSPDIFTVFNSSLGTSGCLENTAWYYGLDNNNDPAEIDFHAVVMHEIAHGLGFLELADPATGETPFGLADAYLINMKDLTTGKAWHEMTPAERLTSQVNSGNLVWTGPSVTADAPLVLGPRPSVVVDSLGSLKGSYEVQPASYGPPLRENGGTTGKMVVVDDGVGVGSDGCQPITNNVSGKLALIDRGECPFPLKTFYAQMAGATGVIVINNVATGLPTMGGDDDPVFTIPSVGVTKEVGDAFKAAASQNIVGKLILDSQFRAGSAGGYVRLYAPNPVAPGSSKSHFDTSAMPNLLMEPRINDDLMPSVFLDLTPNLLEDIGWTLQ